MRRPFGLVKQPPYEPLYLHNSLDSSLPSMQSGSPSQTQDLATSCDELLTLLTQANNVWAEDRKKNKYYFNLQSSNVNDLVFALMLVRA